MNLTLYRTTTTPPIVPGRPTRPKRPGGRIPPPDTTVHPPKPPVIGGAVHKPASPRPHAPKPPAVPGATHHHTAAAAAAYDPMAPWTMTLAQMQRAAHNSAYRNILAQIAGLQTEAQLRAQANRQISGLNNISGALAAGIGQNNAAYQHFASGVTGGFGNAVQAGIGAGNNALAALGQAPTETQGSNLLATMGANMAGALQGAQNAATASGAVYSRAALNALQDQINQRNQKVAGIRGQLGALQDQQLATLKQEALARATAKANSDIANAQFGLKQQAAAATAQHQANQDQAAADRNSIAASTADAKLKQDWAKFQASLAAKYGTSSSGKAGTANRAKYLKDVRDYIARQQKAMQTVTQPGNGQKTYTIIVTVPGSATQPAARYVEHITADSGTRAHDIVAKMYPASAYPDVTYTPNGVSTPAATKKNVRLYNDHQIYSAAIHSLIANGFSRAAATKYVRGIMGLATPTNPVGTVVPHDQPSTGGN